MLPETCTTATGDSLSLDTCFSTAAQSGEPTYRYAPASPSEEFFCHGVPRSQLEEMLHLDRTLRVMDRLIITTTGESDPSEQERELERMFMRFADQWRGETAHLSVMARKIGHPCYLSIIGMGTTALPFIFRDIQRGGRHWFSALQAITNEDPTKPTDSADDAVGAWLQWGRDHGCP